MSKKTSSIILFLPLLLAFIFRCLNLTSYNIYSDSYEFLLAAKNLVERGSLDGKLGLSGMYWGPLFYNRVAFAYFLAPIYTLTKNLELSAHLLSFFAGILAVPLIYFLAVKIFKKREIGFIATLLLAVSFGNVMLSGFIMANSLTVLFIILTLLCFWQAQERDNWPWHLFSGILFALTCFLRAEILITLPAFIIIIILNKKLWSRLLIFLIGFLVFYTFLLITFYRLIDNFALWWSQQTLYLKNFRLSALLITLLIILTAIILSYFLKKKEKWFLARSLKFYTLIVVGSLGLVLITPLIFKHAYNWSATWFTLRTDFLVIIFGFIGIPLLFKKDFSKGLFSYLFTFSLLLIYFAFGGGGDFRHLNLISPLLAILAAFSLWEGLLILRNWLGSKQGFDYKISLLSLLMLIGLLFYGQLYQDIKPWHSLVSYEKEIGLALAKIIKEKNISSETIIISSFPEASYLYTDLSTWEPQNDKPYLPSDIANKKEILLVVDEGIRDRYPELAKIADAKLRPYALKSILSTVKYQYGRKIWWPTRLTNIYLLKASELRKATREQ